MCKVWLFFRDFFKSTLLAQSKIKFDVQSDYDGYVKKEK